MSLTEQINQDIKKAMLAKEKEKLAALRAIKSALLLEGTKDGSGEVSDEVGMGIIQKLIWYIHIKSYVDIFFLLSMELIGLLSYNRTSFEFGCWTLKLQNYWLLLGSH